MAYGKPDRNKTQDRDKKIQPTKKKPRTNAVNLKLELNERKIEHPSNSSKGNDDNDTSSSLTEPTPLTASSSSTRAMDEQEETPYEPEKKKPRSTNATPPIEDESIDASTSSDSGDDDDTRSPLTKTSTDIPSSASTTGIDIQSEELPKTITQEEQDPSADYQDPKTKEFFERITKTFSLQTKDPTLQSQPINFVVVAHTVPDLFEFLKALNSFDKIRPGSKVHAVILKSSAIDEEVEKTLRKTFPNATIHPQKNISENQKITKEKLKADPQVGIELITKASESTHCIVLDIGGYFAPCLEGLNELNREKIRLLGIVEDTENGRKKYKDALEELKKKGIKPTLLIFSVARSKLKKTEDFHVGKSIVDNTATILGRMGLKLEEFKCIGVFGCGKIGRSIAKHLQEKNVQKLLVNDINASILMQAASLGFPPANREQILSESDMLYCATGNGSIIVSKDLPQMRSGKVFVASCTSPDDEFNLQLNHNVTETKTQHHGISCREFKSTEGNTTLCLLADGHAINFALHANPIGNYIRAVNAGIIASSLELTKTSSPSQSTPANQAPKTSQEYQLQTLTPRQEDIISKIWLELFKSIKIGTEANISLDFSNMFHAREKELKDLEDRFFTPQHASNILNMFGESGVGKTELISEFARRNYMNYDFIWRIDAQGDKYGEYKQLAEKLKIPTAGRELTDLVNDIFYKLHSDNKNFLLIYDNVKSPEDLTEIQKYEDQQKKLDSHEQKSQHSSCVYQHIAFLSLESIYQLPQSSTSSTQNTIATVSTCELGNFIEEDMASFVLKQTPILKQLQETYNRSTPNPITELLKVITQNKPLPLLLDTISKYLESTLTKNTKLETINEITTKLRAQLAPLTQPSTHNKQNLALQNILQHILAEIKAIFNQDKHIQILSLLWACIQLDGAHIKDKIIFEFADKNELSRKSTKNYLKILTNYGLLINIDKKHKQKTYRIHTSTHIALKNILSQDQSPPLLQIQTNDTLIKVLSDGFDYNYYEPKTENLDELSEYLHHIETVLNFNKTIEQNQASTNNSENIATLLYKVASFYLNEYRDYNKSLEYYRKLHATLTTLNPEIKKYKILTAIALQGMAANLSKIYRNTNPEKRDPNFLKEALEYAENGLNLFHGNSLEDTLQCIGSDDEYDGYQATLYKVNMLIALGYIHKLRGDNCENNQSKKEFETAEELLNKAIVISDQFIPKTPSPKSSTTDTTLSTSDPNEGIAISDQFIPKTPSPKSSTTDTTLSTSDPNEGKLNANRRVKSLAQHTLGNIILDKCKHNLIPEENIIEQLNEAKDLTEQAIKTRRILHKQHPHPDLASSLHNLAAILLLLSKYDKPDKEKHLKDAQKVCKEAMDLRTKFFTPEHPDFQETKKLLDEIELEIKNLQQKTTPEKRSAANPQKTESTANAASTQTTHPSEGGEPHRKRAKSKESFIESDAELAVKKGIFSTSTLSAQQQPPERTLQHKQASPNTSPLTNKFAQTHPIPPAQLAQLQPNQMASFHEQFPPAPMQEQTPHPLFTSPAPQ